MVVYVITNTVDGKQYVGKTTQSLESRWQQHLSNTRRRSGFRLYQAIRKHGSAAFTIEAVETASDEKELVRLERMWIDKLGTSRFERGYNMATSGFPGEEPVKRNGASPSGRRHTQAAKDRIGAAHKGKAKPVSQRVRMAAHWDEDRRDRQGGIARRVNAAENPRLRDYLCDNCGARFHEVVRGVFGGHRKACLARLGESSQKKAPAVGGGL